MWDADISTVASANFSCTRDAIIIIIIVISSFTEMSYIFDICKMFLWKFSITFHGNTTHQMTQKINC